jgi:1,4-dihydroxy-2-naphthoate octaprenyltransferase
VYVNQVLNPFLIPLFLPSAGDKNMSQDINGLLGPMRPPFLILTPACVVLGLGTAVWTTGQVSKWHFVLTLIGATAAHICVNAFNEFFDFKNGLDFRTVRTPFSGGSGTLPAKPQLERQALATAVFSLIIAGLIGIYFLAVSGVLLLPLGVLGLFLLFAYTPWLTLNSAMCLFAPGLGFGPLMVMGTDFVLSGNYSLTALMASLVPFFLVSNLLLLNQFPDVAADRSVGRRHFPIVIGRRNSSLIYSLFLLCAYLVIILAVYFKFLPKISLLGLLTFLLAVPAGIGVYRFAEDIKKLMPFLGLNVIINVVTPVLVAIGLLIT